MELDGDALETLRRNFVAHGEEGLDMHTFVRVMTETLQRGDKRQRRQVLGIEGERSSSSAGERRLLRDTADDTHAVSLLCEMFQEIDRNGNGKVEWAELTSYWVDKGFVATRRFVAPLRFKYTEDARFKDRHSRGSRINRLVYLPAVGRIASFEKESMRLKLYDGKLRLTADVDVGKAVARFRQSHRRKDSVVNCLVVPKKNILVVVASDLSVTFWDAANLRFQHFGFAKAPMQCLAYSVHTGRVYTAGNCSRVQVWVPEKGLRADFVATRHTEPVTDILVTSELIVTCSLDKTIQLFDLFTHRWKATLVGHRLGIRQLAFSAQQNMLLSVGLEPDGIGWDLTHGKQVVRLVGHRTSIIGLELLHPSGHQQHKTDRAITADRMGNFRVWDVQRSHTGKAACLQVFQRKVRSFHGKSKGKRESELLLKGGKGRWTVDDFHPNTFCLLQGRGDVVAATSKMVRFTTSHCNNMDNLPNVAIYNSTALSFITVTGKDAHIWDARRGVVQQDMFGVASSELTALILDDRERKFIVGTASGAVHVHSYANGVWMKQTEMAHTADVTALAYVGREKIVLSVARDRKLLVHDEWPEDETAPFLRCASAAHDADIACVDYSDAYSLVATGGADATVHVWDFEFLKPDCTIHGHAADVVDAKFLGALPVVVSADAAGTVLFSQVHPVQDKGKVLFRWENWNRLKTHGSGFYYADGLDTRKVRAGLTCMSVHRDASTAAWRLVLGDEMGVIKCFDISGLVDSFGLAERREAAFPCNRTGYNARRRLYRDYKVKPPHMNRPPQVPEVNSPCSSARSSGSTDSPRLPLTDVMREVVAIKAHQAAVNTVHVIDKPFGVLSSSQDRTVVLHSLDADDADPDNVAGAPLGVLNVSDEEEEAVAAGDQEPRPWRFDAGPSVRCLEEQKNEQATSVLRRLIRRDEEPAKLSNQEEDDAPTAAPHDDDDEADDKEDSDEEPPSEAQQQRQLLKMDLLKQVTAGPGGGGGESGSGSGSGSPPSAAEPSRMSEKNYGNLVSERTRNNHEARAAMVVDTAPSGFLREQLSLGDYKNLRERKNTKLKSLSHFRRRFVSKGLLEEIVLEDGGDADDLGPGDSRSTAMRRPSTAPHASVVAAGSSGSMTVSASASALWSRSKGNQEFVDEVESLLQVTVPIASSPASYGSSPSGGSLSGGISKRSATLSMSSSSGNLKRPSTALGIGGQRTAAAAAALETSMQSTALTDEEQARLPPRETWRARSSVLLEKMELIQLEEHASKARAARATRASKVKSRRARPDSAQSWASTSSSTPTSPSSSSSSSSSSGSSYSLPPDRKESGLAIRGKERRPRQRRKSLVDRQSSFGALSLNPKLRRTSSNVRMGSATARTSQCGIRFGPYGEKEVKDLFALFCTFDPNGSGSIDMQEFYTSPEWRNSPLATSLGSIFESMDEDGDAQIDLGEFLGCFCTKAQPQEIRDMVCFLHGVQLANKRQETEPPKRALDDSALEEIEALFNQLDVDGDGAIQLSELKQVATHNSVISEKDVNELMNKYASQSGADDDGEERELDKKAFVELCRDYFSYSAEGDDEVLKQVVNTSTTQSRYSK